MLSDASRAGNASTEWFDPQYWHGRGVASRAPGGRGTTLFVGDGARQWVLRHYHRGGLVAKVLADRYLWTGEANTRPFREWRLLAEMLAAGLPVPAPIAARYRRNGLFYRGDLITGRIAGAQPLSALLAARPVESDVWRKVGACLRRLRDHGVWHADLNAHNVLIDEHGAVTIVDFDRARRRKPGAWSNLGRLRHSLLKIARQLPAGRFGEPQWRELCAGYGPA